MSFIGKRKGKKRALHLPGEIVDVRGKGPFQIFIDRIMAGGRLCFVESNVKMKNGLVWIVIAPAEDSNEGMVLSKIEAIGEREVSAVFESKDGSFMKAEVILDNRGRAKNLATSGYYRFSLMEPERFFSAYERKSIPSGEKGKSEPDETGRERIELFTNLSSIRAGEKVLDSATGIKGYLQSFVAKDCFLVCLNISTPILERTREWLDSESACFVRYDADIGFPFKEGCFDVIIVDALLEYTRDPPSVLRRCRGIIKRGGRLLLLEPIKSVDIDFYPQDLWELALWRPLHDKGFSRKTFEKVLNEEGFELIERRDMEFVYPIFREERFSQSAAVYKKLFI